MLPLEGRDAPRESSIVVGFAPAEPVEVKAVPAPGRGALVHLDPGLGEGVARPLAVAVVVEISGAGDPEHAAAILKISLFREVIERGQKLAPGQIPRAADDDEEMLIDRALTCCPAHHWLSGERRRARPPP